MMKLNKDTFEVEFVDTLTCFCGGGSDDDDGGSNDNNNSGGGDPSFYDNERPGIPGGNRPVGGTTNVFEGSSQPSNNDDNDSSPPQLPPQPADPNFYSDLAAAAAEAAAALPAAPPPVDLGIATGTSQPVDISVGSTNMPPAVITGPSGEVIDTTTGNIISGNVDRYTGMNTDPLGQQYSTLLGNVNNALTNQDRFVNRRFRNAVNSGAIVDPNFDAAGQLDGFAANTGPFGSMVYTGTNNPNAPSDTSGNDIVPPQTNPLTGTSQCPDGYVFDDDLQACRRKTKRELRGDGNSSTASGDMYYRRTSLDDAPANLPSGFDFDAANRAFTQSFAVRPSFFQRPPNLTGYTLL